jgi:hypothetical protein
MAKYAIQRSEKLVNLLRADDEWGKQAQYSVMSRIRYESLPKQA